MTELDLNYGRIAPAPNMLFQPMISPEELKEKINAEMSVRHFGMVFFYPVIPFAS